MLVLLSVEFLLGLGVAIVLWKTFFPEHFAQTFQSDRTAKKRKKLERLEKDLEEQLTEEEIGQRIRNLQRELDRRRDEQYRHNTAVMDEVAQTLHSGAQAPSADLPESSDAKVRAPKTGITH
jgi:hypothetical protein